ncbi:helix-turn-helix domain-containing protein [Rhizobium laguerreae]|uniref:helix-turn-helix domain-containing protein n=1 Tax=Rhizobium laguerreae TaxID=1076926 RepID=UPI001C8FE8EB|nr:XRE family transcriptional regulator [Rhizobium laguerreae]MBY3389213.1 ImmA/IrrE family metallo-endopeptidase [Rhizobium laguerreae]MBY3402964.1 ImmA/IrrE family metallo-endopeptidase [Rhizobium laguerreae]MBY3409903.1 ImmA/IrrE family metallo-endopeptidase [Rhizobium laguerreae]
MLGSRLRIARAAMRLSLRELSERISGLVSPQAIGKYERGEDIPSPPVLKALSVALGVSVAHLETEEQLTLESVEFRRGMNSAKEEASVQAKAITLLQHYLEIEAILGLESTDWEKPRGVPFPVNDLRDAEDAARSVREAWSLGNDPIPRLAELLEERGIKVLSVDLDDIDGLAAYAPRRDRDPARVIVVKRNTWSERKRFTMAHELGHMVLGLTTSINAEKAAHRFAGAFLLPADMLRAEVGATRSTISLGELAALKRRYGVSLQALTYRCRELGIISEATFSELFKVFAERGWRAPPFKEPECMPEEYELPRRFERLCLRAYSEKLIDISHASELLGTPEGNLKKRLSFDWHIEAPD